MLGSNDRDKEEVYCSHCSAWEKHPSSHLSKLWRNVRLNREEYVQFFFCANDIERCVRGSHRKWVISYSNTLERPPIPTIWPVKIGTNLTRSKIEALENADFQLP